MSYLASPSFVPKQSHAVIQRANQDVGITVFIHVHPSVDGVAERVELSISHRLTLNYLQRATMTNTRSTQ